MKVKKWDDNLRFTLDKNEVGLLLIAILRKIEDPKTSELIGLWQASGTSLDWNNLLENLNLGDVPFYVNHVDGLALSDDLVEALFPIKKETQHLRLARICVDCHVGYVSEKAGHECQKEASDV
jgi:hypothetical protein